MLDTDGVLPTDQCAFECTASMLSDGKCDEACMNKVCNLDAEHAMNNGVCEPACATAACGYDEIDCSCVQNVIDACDGSDRLS